jgi:hypothetical protein
VPLCGSPAKKVAVRQWPWAPATRHAVDARRRRSGPNEAYRGSDERLHTRGTTSVRPGSFEQVPFTTVDPDGQADLSDHCPIAVVFETDGEIKTSDAIAVLLDGLEAVQAELEEIRAGLVVLQE